MSEQRDSEQIDRDIDALMARVPSVLGSALVNLSEEMKQLQDENAALRDALIPFLNWNLWGDQAALAKRNARKVLGL